MNSVSPSVALNDGHFIPVLGFGTTVPHKLVPKNEAIKATKMAIDAGFRHFDSAYLYRIEEEVGQAIRSKIADGTVKREDIFYTSKLWSTFHRPELVRSCLEITLKKAQLDYVDLYIIHFPMALQPGDDYFPKDEHGNLLIDPVDLCDTWEAMEKCKDAGLARSIGVSNFNRRQLEMILNKPGLKYKPVCNQVECHVYLNQSKMLDYCKSKDIALVAYCTLGSSRDTLWVDQNSPVLLEDPVLCAMAKKYKQTPALVALRYLLQRGIVVLARSFNEKRIKENMKVFEFQLTSEDIKVLDGLNKNLRYNSADYLEEDCWFSKKYLNHRNREVEYTRMNPKHCVVLSDGHRIPVLGFGTFAPEEVPKSMATEATKIAIDAGFRHIDAAYLYQNEEEVGLAIRSKIADGTVKREDIFYTSKLPSTCHRPEMVRLCLEKSLKKLQLEYVDLYLIHFPVSMKPDNDLNPALENGKFLFDTVDLRDTWEAMEKCKDAGLTRSIGVSNFNRRQLEMILNKPGLKYKPVCNQVECHPYFNQSKLLDYCKSKDIVLVAYGALGTQRYKKWIDENAPYLLEDPILCAMAEKHKQTPALISLRYLLQRGIVVLAKSFNEKRIKENMKVFEFQLPAEDMAVIDSLNKNYRYATANVTSAHPDYPYSDEY
ncbi:3-alpha-hydroxysteroid dehydrogenase [Sigmodon hispidus]